MHENLNFVSFEKGSIALCRNTKTRNMLFTECVEFSFYHKLNNEHKEKFRWILENIDLLNFPDVHKFEEVDKTEDEYEEMLKNFEYALERDCDDIRMKFIVLFAISRFKFFDEYIIEQYLSSYQYLKNYRRVRVEHVFNTPQYSVYSCEAAEEFIFCHQLSALSKTVHISKTLNDMPKNSFLNDFKINEPFNSNTSLNVLYKNMYFLKKCNKRKYSKIEHEKMLAFEKSLQGYEETSIVELASFFVLTSFEDKWNKFLEGQKIVENSCNLPILSKFTQRYNVECSLPEFTNFIKTFKSNLVVVELHGERKVILLDHKHNSVFKQYYFYAFLYILIKGNKEKFSEFCDFVLSNECYEWGNVLAVEENTELFKQWGEEDSDVSVVPFNLLANMF